MTDQEPNGITEPANPSGAAIASSGGITQLSRVLEMVKSGHSTEEIAAWAEKEMARLAGKAPDRAIRGRSRRATKSGYPADQHIAEHQDAD